ncbi:MAG: zinc-dependent peptidase [Mariprofundaceae bacterium]|nr:zinc-dependent peptidase [Mariprofundaceae bacterium]
MHMWVIILSALAIGGLWGVLWYRHIQKRNTCFHAPFPEGRLTTLQTNIALYQRLPNPLQRELQGLIQVFVHEKQFVGCGGLEVDDEMRVTIAAFACVLLLNRPHQSYPHFSAIYVYPDAYIVKLNSWDGVVESENSDVLLGESWQRGLVVLSWQAVLHGVSDTLDGHNVVYHEFAHKLDEEGGAVDGVPLLANASHHQSWARTMSNAFEALREKSNKGEATVLDDYGASEPEEFFAVLTETFFEKPHQLKASHPALYDEVRAYYRLDPAAWVKSVKLSKIKLPFRVTFSCFILLDILF